MAVSSSSTSRHIAAEPASTIDCAGDAAQNLLPTIRIGPRSPRQSILRTTSNTVVSSWRRGTNLTCSLALLVLVLVLTVLYLVWQDAGHGGGVQQAPTAVAAATATPGLLAGWLSSSGLSSGGDASTLSGSRRKTTSTPGASAPSAKSKTYARSQSRVAAPPSRWSAPKLSEQLVRQHALKNTIIVAFSNKNHLDYTFNWINYVRGLNITNYLVGALDAITARELLRQDVHTFNMYEDGTELPAGDLMFLSAGFLLLGQHKVPLARQINSYGVDLVLSDVDTVWFKNPLEYFARYPEVDVLATTDVRRPTNNDDGLEAPQACGMADMNIGLMRLRYSPNMTIFLEAWQTALDEGGSEVWDQGQFNHLLRLGMFLNHGSFWDHTPDHDRTFNIIHPHETIPRVIWGFHDTVSVGLLPIAGFPNGHAFFTQRLYEDLPFDLYVAHANYVAGGYKRHRFRETGLWSYDHQDYYNKGFYLSFDMKYPEEPPNWEQWDARQRVGMHLQALQLQQDQFWKAAATAVALKRIIILPKFLCFCDELWMYALEDKEDVKCKFPGADAQQLPFICPQDHMLNILSLTDMDEKHGPAIWYRESTFMENPRVPPEVKGDVLTVAFDQPPRAPLGQQASQAAKGGGKRPNRLLISTGKSIAAAFGARGNRGGSAAADVAAADAAPETTSNTTTPPGRKRIREEAPLPGERSQPRLQELAAKALGRSLAADEPWFDEGIAAAGANASAALSASGGSAAGSPPALKPRKAPVVHLPSALHEDELKEELDDYIDVRVIHLANVPELELMDQYRMNRRRSHATLEAHKPLIFAALDRAGVIMQ